MDNPETLIFRDDWKPVYNPVNFETEKIDDVKQENEQTNIKKKRAAKPILILIQISLCLIALLSLYTFKALNSPLLDDIYKWYEDNINNEIIIKESFNDFNIDSFLNAVKDK